MDNVKPNWDLKFPSEFLGSPISILRLSNRANNSLSKAGIQTVEQLLNARSSNYINIRWFGERARLEVEVALRNFIEPPNVDIDPRPFLLTLDDVHSQNFVNVIPNVCKKLLKAMNYSREYEVLKRRYGLEDSPIYTLQQIGDYYGITRERVRQLEERAKKKIQGVLSGSMQLKKWRIPDELIEESKLLFQSLINLGIIITEVETIKIIEERYRLKRNAIDINSVRLLLNLAGFKQLPNTSLETVGIVFEPAWELPGKVDKVVLFKVIRIIRNLLIKEVKPVSLFDITIQVNRKLKKKNGYEYIELAVKIYRGIEKLSNEMYQLRFEALPSIGDKAYRVLYEARKPLHIQDILREINFRQIKAGYPADVILRSLQQQLSNDKRFDPIGRSGEWSLSDWENISKETILKLMQEFFHLNQTSATPKEVYEYVSSKRSSVRRQSICTYLAYQRNLFVKVSENKYALAVWGLKPFTSGRRVRKSRNFSIDSEIRFLFAQENVVSMPLSMAIKKIHERTGRPEGTIRNEISKSTCVLIEPHPSFSRRKLLRYLGEEQQHLSKAKAEKVTIRDTVRKEIVNFLQGQPESQAPLTMLAAFIVKKTGCRKGTFYRYLDEMENVKKVTSGKIVICKLITSSTNELINGVQSEYPQIINLNDEELRDNLKRAIKNLNIDNVDLCLFQLGKIFEVELKAFLLKAKDKNIFPVTSGDLDRLASMIDCVERNRVITKKHHLTLLREQRNERAHGHIPNLIERQKLLQYAPFLVDLYLEYIILLNCKRHEI